jgi:hypothetical protein
MGLAPNVSWANTLDLAALVISMAVNALVTGLIVFKILNVFLKFKSTSVEQTLGSLSSTGGRQLRHIVFIIIESGMTLFAIQLVRIVLASVVEQTMSNEITRQVVGMEIVITINQMFNVITIRSVHFVFSTDDIHLGRVSRQQ